MLGRGLADSQGSGYCLRQNAQRRWYSLLQHSTPVQIRFFLSVLHHMSQSDPMTALLSPHPAQPGMQAQMEARLAGSNLKSPSAGGGAGFSGSPTMNHYLNPESALETNGNGSNRSKLRQNRISAPGTLVPSERWQGSLDQVIERGSSPGADSVASNRSRSPSPDIRPKSTAFDSKGKETQEAVRSPRVSDVASADLGQPAFSPLLSGNWASMTNTPLVPMFPEHKVDNVASALSVANAQLNHLNQLGRVQLDDARRYRRPGVPPSGATSRHVSGASAYDDHGHLLPRSPILDPYALSSLGFADPALAGLANLNLGLTPQQAQMLALAQAQQQLQTAASFTSPGYGGIRSGRPSGPPGRRSPLLGGKSHSPAPPREGGGGAGGGAGVAGPDDVDMRILEDTLGWLPRSAAPQVQRHV